MTGQKGPSDRGPHSFKPSLVPVTVPSNDHAIPWMIAPIGVVPITPVMVLIARSHAKAEWPNLRTCPVRVGAEIHLRGCRRCHDYRAYSCSCQEKTSHINP